MTTYINSDCYESKTDGNTHTFRLTKSNGIVCTASLTAHVVRGVQCHLVWIVGFIKGISYFDVQRKLDDGVLDLFDFFKAQAKWDRNEWESNGQATVTDFYKETANFEETI